MNSQNVKLSIWDTAGQERYHALNASFYRGSDGALVVYDITDKDSFDKAEAWVKELQKYLPAKTPIMIAGNKCDITNRQVPLETAESFALSIGGKHYGTSAKTGAGVQEIFSSLT